MGDKGKKDKEKGQKQNTDKQKQKATKKLEKQPKRTSWRFRQLCVNGFTYVSCMLCLCNALRQQNDPRTLQGDIVDQFFL